MSIPKRYHPVLMACIMAPLGMGVGYVIGKLFKGNLKSLDMGWEAIPVAILVLWLVLATHELGHAIGGWLAGFSLHFYAVGPLRIDQQAGRFKVSFNRTPSLWGGMAASSPDPQNIPPSEPLRRKMLLLVAGGPLASLLSGLMAFPAILLWPTHPRWAFAIMVFAFASLLIAFVTMLPIGNSGFVNDGGRILQLLRRSEAAYRWISLATLGTLASQVRPRLWPAHLIEDTTRNPEPSYDGIMSMWMRFSWHLDRKEIPEAKLWLERALTHVEDWPAAAQPILHSSAADFYARLEPDIPRARQHLAQAQKPGFMQPEAIALAEASVLIAEGNAAAAREKLTQARKLITTTSGSSRDSIAELINELAAKA